MQTFESGLILHQRSYKETSLMLEVFTAKYGRLNMVANGAKRPKSKWRGILMPFIPLSMCWSGKIDKLLTLTAAECHSKIISLIGLRLISGLYINELLLKLLAPCDPYPQLYDNYCSTLNSLACSNTPLEVTLRTFEINLLSEIGYQLPLLQEAYTKQPLNPHAWYLFDPSQGPICVPKTNNFTDTSNSKLIFLGKTLLAIQQVNFTDPSVLLAAKQLMRYVINYHLNGRLLETRFLLSKFHS